MIYPNNNIEISQLLMMIKSPEYNVYFESKDEHYPLSRRPLTDPMQLPSALTDELLGKGKICYDITDTYNERHPRAGNEKMRVNDEDFFWEYRSPHDRCYRIQSCTYIGEKPKYIPLELVLFNSDFNSSCFQLGSWSRDDEGYEFHSCGSRIFDNVGGIDLPLIWNAISRADEFLGRRFMLETN